MVTRKETMSKYQPSCPDSGLLRQQDAKLEFEPVTPLYESSPALCYDSRYETEVVPRYDESGCDDSCKIWSTQASRSRAEPTGPSINYTSDLIRLGLAILLAILMGLIFAMCILLTLQPNRL